MIPTSALSNLSELHTVPNWTRQKSKAKKVEYESYNLKNRSREPASIGRGAYQYASATKEAASEAERNVREETDAPILLTGVEAAGSHEGGVSGHEASTHVAVVDETGL